MKKIIFEENVAQNSIALLTGACFFSEKLKVLENQFIIPTESYKQKYFSKLKVSTLNLILVRKHIGAH